MAGRKSGLGASAAQGGVNEDFLAQMVDGNGEAPQAVATKPTARRGRKPDPDAALTVGAYFKLNPDIIKKLKLYMANNDDFKSKGALVERALVEFFESRETPDWPSKGK